MSLNQVILTNKGLLNINRKIIDKRKFNPDFINVEGTVTLEDGIASDLDKTSYLYKDNLNFEGTTFEDSVSIIFEGSYTSSITSNTQTAWYLSGPNNKMIMQFYNNYPQLILPSGITINFDYLSFPDESTFKIITSIYYDETSNSQRCSVTLDYDGEVIEETRTIPNPIDFTAYDAIFIGNNPTKTTSSTNYFWEDVINIKNFIIERNSLPFFTPTDGYSLQFTSIAISDDKFVLPSDSAPPSINKHLYLYNINQISRSNNTLLLTTELGKDSKLVIKRIGLYAKLDNSEEFLFGYIDNLNVDKGADVPYNLVLTVDLAISTVNVIGFPANDSFILEQVKPILLENFTTALSTNTYVIENLERIIRMNSLQPTRNEGYCGRTGKYTAKTLDGRVIEHEESYEPKFCCNNPSTIKSIGYNTPEIVYQLQRKIGQQEDCYSAIQTYTKLHKNFTKEFEEILDLSQGWILSEGDMTITPDGIASGFTTSDYLYVPVVLNNNTSWEFNLAFSVSLDSNTRQNILALGELYTSENDQGEVVESIYTHFMNMYINDYNTLVIGNYDTEYRVLPHVKYQIRLNYLPEEELLKILIVPNKGDTWERTISTTSFPYVENINKIFVGIESTYEITGVTETLVTSNPFTYGTLPLIDWSLSQGNRNWTNRKEIYSSNNKLLQFYHIPGYNKLFYRVYDICSDNYYLNFTDKIFKGNEDLIDFSKEFSLCLKINLKDNESKLLIAKTNKDNQELFKLEFINNEDGTYNFQFSLLQENGETIIFTSNTISSIQVAEYLNNQFLFTIFKDENNNIYFYKNNQPFNFDYLQETSSEENLDYETTSPVDLLNIPSYEGSYLTNSLTEKDDENYVQDIILIENVIDSKQLYYITNLTDTNFTFSS